LPIEDGFEDIDPVTGGFWGAILFELFGGVIENME
jgi:hypothetical protein